MTITFYAITFYTITFYTITFYTIFSILFNIILLDLEQYHIISITNTSTGSTSFEKAHCATQNNPF